LENGDKGNVGLSNAQKHYKIESKCYAELKSQAVLTYESLILHRVADASSKQPQWPEILKTEVEDEVSHQYKHPHTEELYVRKCAEDNTHNDSLLQSLCKMKFSIVEVNGNFRECLCPNTDAHT